MVGFCKKNIEDNSIGQLFCQARQFLGMDLDTISQEIGVDRIFLQAIEKNEFNKLPGKVYAINFFRKYAEFLCLDIDQIEARLQKECILFRGDDISCKNFQRKEALQRASIDPKNLRNFGVILLAVLIGVYLFSLVYRGVSLPKIQIVIPEFESVVDQQKILIEGVTDPNATVNVGDYQVSVLDDGRFQYEAYLVSGLNEINFRAKKRYSKENEITHKIIYLKD